MTLSALTIDQMENQLSNLIGREYIQTNRSIPPNESYRISAPLTVFPRNENDVVRIMKWAFEHRVKIVPQGGGTKDALGNPVSTDVIVSMKNIRGIVEHSVGDLIVSVLPGTTFADLQQALGERGQFLPLDPPCAEESTIGGIISSNMSGPHRAMYGSARDYVIATRMVYPDGRVIKTGAKVVKNVAGYDMNKLFIGAMGTLGIMTELTLKIRPIPAFSGISIVSASEENLRGLQEALLDSQLEPCVCEWLNQTLIGDLELLSPASAVVIGFEDVKSAVTYQMDWVNDYCKANSIQVMGEYYGSDKTKVVYRNMGSMIPNANQTNHDDLTVAVKLLSSLTPVPLICNQVQQAADRLGLVIRLSGGMYTGISRASVNTQRAQEDAVMEWISQTQEITRQHHGHTVVEFAPIDIRKSVSVWGDSNSTSLMKGIKQSIDPFNLLNAGRFVGGI